MSEFPHFFTANKSRHLAHCLIQPVMYKKFTQRHSRGLHMDTALVPMMKVACSNMYAMVNDAKAIHLRAATYLCHMFSSRSTDSPRWTGQTLTSLHGSNGGQNSYYYNVRLLKKRSDSFCTVHNVNCLPIPDCRSQSTGVQ